MRPFLNDHIRNAIHFHNSMESLHEEVPKEILPQELGGDTGPFDNYESAKAVFDIEPHFYRVQEMIKANKELQWKHLQLPLESFFLPKYCRLKMGCRKLFHFYLILFWFENSFILLGNYSILEYWENYFTLLRNSFILILLLEENYFILLKNYFLSLGSCFILCDIPMQWEKILIFY